MSRAVKIYAAAVLVALLALVGAWFDLASDGGILNSVPEEAWHWDKPAHVVGRTVSFTFDGGSCDVSRRVKVRETDERVVLTVLTRDTAGSCAGVELAGLRLDARLRRPLGNRELVDGACTGGDEPGRGNCPPPVTVGRCAGARYQVDTLVDGDGAASVRIRLAGAEPRQEWRFRWERKNAEAGEVQTADVRADVSGQVFAVRTMGDVSRPWTNYWGVSLRTAGVRACTVAVPMPISYGS